MNIVYKKVKVNPSYSAKIGYINRYICIDFFVINIKLDKMWIKNAFYSLKIKKLEKNMIKLFINRL